MAGEVSVPGTPSGVSVTGDGRYVLVATGRGAVVIDASRVEAGASAGVVATLESPVHEGGGRGGRVG